MLILGQVGAGMSSNLPCFIDAREVTQEINFCAHGTPEYKAD